VERAAGGQLKGDKKILEWGGLNGAVVRGEEKKKCALEGDQKTSSNEGKGETLTPAWITKVNVTIYGETAVI